MLEITDPNLSRGWPIFAGWHRSFGCSSQCASTTSSLEKLFEENRGYYQLGETIRFSYGNATMLLKTGYRMRVDGGRVSVEISTNDP